MKRIITLAALLLTLVLTLSFVSCKEKETTNNSGVHALSFRLLEDGTYSAKFGNDKNLTSVKIPGDIDGIPVTAIDESGFLGSQIETVQITGSIKKIGNDAFFGCKNLKNVIIEGGVEEIGDRAFFGCEQLGNIVIPASVRYMGYDVFGENEKINVYFEAKELGSDQFSWLFENPKCKIVWGYNNITSNKDFDYTVHNGKAFLTSYKGTSETVVVPERVADRLVGGICFAFRGNETVKRVEIPNGFTEVYPYAFENCKNLESVVLADSVKSIGLRAFSGCEKLTDVKLPQGITSIGYGWFGGCTGLVDFEIPASVTSIEDYAFENTGFVNVTIPNSVTEIGLRAFWKCENLESVVIPTSVSTVGAEIFDYSEKVTIKCQAQSQPSGWNEKWNSLEYPVVWGYKN